MDDFENDLLFSRSIMRMKYIFNKSHTVNIFTLYLTVSYSAGSSDVLMVSISTRTLYTIKYLHV